MGDGLYKLEASGQILIVHPVHLYVIVSRNKYCLDQVNMSNNSSKKIESKLKYFMHNFIPKEEGLQNSKVNPMKDVGVFGRTDDCTHGRMRVTSIAPHVPPPTSVDKKWNYMTVWLLEKNDSNYISMFLCEIEHVLFVYIIS